ncbi:MAG: DUF6489 family protein [Alphaproteobacteria bacterium]
MKFTMNVECTPEEARAFCGLPDVQPMQERLLSEVEARMKDNLRAMTPEAIFGTWLPAGIQNMEQLQKLFWGQMQQGMSGFNAAKKAE